ncbi:MAG: RsmB/NOP family class I SAM-dependent RNA methyltransferase [Alphaproteobacteria bacterium]|nr:RsmB/NOP family class I SAM-dependent RNA methyltransferase [Alphaproteobacteria bacterium]NCQ88948.1 RsmB/NOP family class I SAM-dependent RNA methyltransferase [Alphaproteobacteria bacterium]NCT07850.1 RsmB/NOP family class I SAM-dependent RNA methyltransferase [Alphaproteobacteria bacterium]
MKQGACIQAVIDISERIAKSRIPMDNVLRDYMQHKRYIGSKDRASIVELAYDVMRSTARLGWWLDTIKSADTPRLRVLAYLCLAEEKNKFLLDQIFDGEKYSPEVLTSEEYQIIKQLEGKTLDHDEMPDDVRAECPPWAVDRLKALYGDNFEHELKAMLPTAALDLRVNTIKTDIEGVQKSLAKDGVITHKTPYSPVALRVEGKAYMSATKAFHAGLVEIQDEGSQLIALVCGVKPGMRVLDFCAGGGGKTLALAAQMENKGIIMAMDNDSRRLEKGRRRYKKAGVHNIEVRSLEDEKNRKWLRRQKGTMDVVLVDAPCSSSGTWRRNPDLRWNQYGPSLDEIKVMQEEILERVADKVKPEGRLVYATCSLFPEENENQVKKFLEKHPDYEVLPLSQIWDSNWGKKPESDPYLRLSPLQSNTDGFFAAILQRKNS